MSEMLKEQLKTGSIPLTEAILTVSATIILGGLAPAIILIKRRRTRQA